MIRKTFLLTLCFFAWFSLLLVQATHPAIVTTASSFASSSFEGGMAIDSDGNVYYSNGSHIYRQASVDSASGVKIVEGISSIKGLSISPTGALVFSSRGQIYRMSVSGATQVVAGALNINTHVDGPSAAARFGNSLTQTMDANGNIYVADKTHHTIRKISTEGYVTTLAGSAGTQGSTDGAGHAALFQSPYAIIMDADGSMIVLDYHHVRRVTSSGTVTTLANLSGIASGIVRHPDGNYYISINGAVQRVTPEGNVTTIAGSLTVWGFNIPQEDGIGEDARFYKAQAIAIAPDGALIVGDPNRFRRVAINDVPIAPVIATQPTSVTALLEDDVTLSAISYETQPAYYQWKKDGIDIFGKTDPSIELNDLAIVDSGTYTLSITNAYGSVTTMPAVLNVVTVVDNDSFTDRPALSTAPVSAAAEWIGTTREDGEPIHAEGNDGGSLWWSWTAPSTGFVTVDSSASTAASITEVYSGTDLASLIRVSPDEAYVNTNNESRKTFAVTAGSTYQIAVERVSQATPGVVHLMIDYSYIVTTLAGTPGQDAITNATGAAARFSQPAGIVQDSSGNLFIADSTTIRKVTPAGVVTTFVTGAFNRPSGLVIDTSGNLYMADTSNHVIRKITPGGSVSIIAGSIVGYGDYQDGTGSAARFHFPKGLAVDGAGNVYVADQYNHVIRKITPGGITTTLTGEPRISGFVDGVSSVARFEHPTNVTLIGLILYVSDRSGIRAVDITSGETSTFSRESSPNALGHDSEGNLYVADSNSITRISPTGAMNHLLGGNSVSNNIFTEGDGPLAGFRHPNGIYVGGSGEIYFSTLNSVSVAAPTNAASLPIIYAQPSSQTIAIGSNVSLRVTAFGGPTVAYQWNKGGLPISGQNDPVLSFVSASLVDAGDYTVTVSSPSGSVVSDGAVLAVVPVPANDDFANAASLTGVSASGTGSNYGASRETGEPTMPGEPSGKTVWWSWTAPTDGTVVVDSGGSGIKVSLGVYSGNTLATLQLIAHDDNLEEADDANVNLQVTSGTTYHFALDGIVGASAEDGDLQIHVNYVYAVTTLGGGYGHRDGPLANALFAAPRSMTLDLTGNIYLSDQQSDTIRKITPAGMVSTLAGSPWVSGVTDGTGSNAHFDYVYDMTTDSSGNLYLVEFSAHVVRKITPGGVVTTIAGTANVSGSSDGAGAGARFYRPSSIAYSPDGFLYVYDSGYGAYRKVDPVTGVVTTVDLSSIDTDIFSNLDGEENFYNYNAAKQTLQKTWPSGHVVNIAGAFDVNRSNRDGVGENVRFNSVTSMVVEVDGTIYLCDNQAHILRKAVPSNISRIPIIVSTSQDAVVSTGTDVEFSIEADASPFPSFVWKRNGTVVAGENTSALNISNVQLVNGGDYTVEVTNIEGTVVSKIMTLEVFDAPSNDAFVDRILIPSLPSTIEGHNFLTSVENDEPLHFEAGAGHSVWWSWTAPTDGLVMLNTQFSPLDTLVAVYTGSDLNSLVLIASGGRSASSLPARLIFAVTAGTRYQIALDGRSGVTGKLGFELFYASDLEEVNPTIGGQGIVAAPDGNFYFADGLNHVIRKMTSAGVVTDVAGQAGTSGSVDGVGGAAQFNWPSNLVRATDGTLYVTDSNHTIRRIAPDGTVSTIAGSAGITGSDDGIGASARFFSPSGIALSADEAQLVIVDRSNKTLRVLELATGNVTTLAGTAGVVGYSDGAGPSARFIGPRHIQLAPAGNFYITDVGSTYSPYSGSRYYAAIREVTLSGNVSTLAGAKTNSSWGHVDGEGFQAKFNNGLQGLCLDNQGDILVSDTGWIRRVTPEGVVTTLSESGSRFDDLAIAPDGTGYAVSYNKTYKLGVFDHTYIPLSPVITTHPFSIDRFIGQNVYFSVTASGDQSSFTYQWQFNGSPISGATAKELILTDVTLVDAGDYTVVVTNGGGSTTSNIATITVKTRPVNDDFNSAVILTGSEAFATANNFGAGKEADEPVHGGNVGGASLWWTWTATSSGAVIVDSVGTKFDALLGVYTGNSLATLSEVASASQDIPSNNAYVPQRTSVTFTAIAGTTYHIAMDADAGLTGDVELRINYTYSFSTIVGQAGVSGYADGNGKKAIFSTPRSIVTDAVGNIFVADTWNHVIRKISPTGDVTTIAGLAGVSGFTDGTGSAARFYHPGSIVLATNGDFFVTDSFNHVIRKITPAGVVSTFAGSAGSSGSVNGVGASARFNSPSHLAIDGSGNLFVTESGKNWVRKIAPDATVSTLAGQADTIGAVDDTGTAALFNYPTGLTCDSSGNVFVCDNRTVRKITPSAVVTTVAGVAGDSAFVDGSAGNVRLAFPNSIAVRSDGAFLLADGEAIRMIQTDGSCVTLVGGNRSSSTITNGTGRDVRFRGLSQIWIDSNGVLYTTETTGSIIRRGILSSSPSSPAFSLQPIAHRIIEGTDITLTGEALANPSPTYQWQKNGIDIPGATTVSLALNNTQVPESGNYTLVATNTIGATSSAVAVIEILPLPANDAFANRSSLSGERAETHAYNYLATAESNESFHAGSAAAHSVWFTWTAPGSGNVTIDTIGSSIGTRLGVYRGNAMDALSLVAGSASSSEQGFSRVRFNAAAGEVFQIAVDGVAGATGDFRLTIEYSWTFGLHSGGFGIRDTTDGSLIDARYNFPASIASDSQGNIFVADRRNHTIRKITPAGIVLTFAGSPEVSGYANGVGSDARFYYPYGLTVDHMDNLYVADMGNNSIRKITPAGEVSLLAGSGSPELFGSDDGAGIAARFKMPIGVAVDASGHVFVTDYANRLIRKITPLGVVTTFAGTLNNIGNNGQYFNVPWGVAVDPTGNVYVSDRANIRKITPDGIVSVFAGNAVGYTGSVDGFGKTARFNRPCHIAFNDDGDLFVTDTNNQLIRKVSPDGTVRTLGGIALSRTFRNGTADFATFADPMGITFSHDGTLYIADSLNQLVRSGSQLIAREQTITFDAPANVNDVSSPLTLVASASSALPVSFLIVSGPAELSDDSLSITGIGTVTVRATQLGNASFLSAIPVERSFEVSGFDAWLRGKFTTDDLSDITISGHGADPDGDGLKNLVEYALGFDPKQKNYAPHYVLNTTATHWVYTYTRPASRPDLTFTVEMTTNMTSWSISGIAHERASSNSGVETWRATLPVGAAPRAFFRLKVAQQ